MKCTVALWCLLVATPVLVAQDTSFVAMQQRGKIAMGVDQYTSVPVFDDLPDGGRIELQRDRDDPAGTRIIRDHLRSIAQAFLTGDFSTSALVHMQEVPGSRAMAARRIEITYTFRELPRGGELWIISRDTTAVRAIHQFLSFQRGDHHRHCPPTQASLGNTVDPVYLRCQVTEPVRWSASNARAVYPSMLLRAGIGGLVRFLLVVDQSGRIDSSSIRTLKSPHALFETAGRSALRTWSATPATVGPKPVRQLVDVVFVFAVAESPASCPASGQQGDDDVFVICVKGTKAR